MASLPSRRMRHLQNILLANLVLVGTIVLAVACAWLLQSLTADAMALSTIPLMAASLIVTAGAVAAHPAVTWASLGLGPRSLSGVAWGALAGSAACGALVAVAVACQWAEWTPIGATAPRFDWRELRAAGTGILVAGSIGEELFLRGLVLQLLARSVGPLWAVAATAAIFAVLHGANPDVTLIAQANTALFGAVFGLAVVRRRSLGLAIGLHFGWNLAQVVLGANTSGITMRLTDLNLVLREPDWLTGGGYGLEGGVLATGMALLLAAALWPQRGQRPAAPMLWECDDA